MRLHVNTYIHVHHQPQDKLFTLKTVMTDEPPNNEVNLGVDEPLH